MIGQGKGSSSGGGLDTLMGSPLMQTLTGNNRAPEMAGNSAKLDLLSMLQGNKNYWDEQKANIQQGGQNFAGNLQDLAQLFLGNQGTSQPSAALPPITRPAPPQMVMTTPGLQHRPPTPAAVASEPVQPQRPPLKPRDRWGYR